MNYALLYKWRWRALNNPNSLWVKIVSAIHGDDCFVKLTAKHRGLWHTIVEIATMMHNNYDEFRSCISRKVGDGAKSANTRFWKDIWMGDTTLAHQYPRLYAIETRKDCCIKDCWQNLGWNWLWRRPLMSSKENQMLGDLIAKLPISFNQVGDDKWFWKFNGKSYFSVGEIRRFLDHKRLPVDIKLRTRWNNLVPKKLNIFVWRLRRNTLPTLVNLFAKGIDISSVTCVNCKEDAELMEHTFKDCKFVAGVRRLLSKWIKVTIPANNPNDILEWCDNLKVNNNARKRLEAILYSWWWHVWKIRNNKYHNSSTESILDAYNSIVSGTFIWIKHRQHRCSLTWDDWIANPLIVL